MEKKLEIKKLADVVVWADNLITAAGYNEEKYKSDSATAYCYVRAHELWKIKEVALESINRHNTYTNALNRDIAAKAAKIDLLEKEIEGRKKAFNDLREEMANRYITIETHNDICKTYEDSVDELKKELADCKVKIRHQKENLDGINKTLEIRTKENESLIQVRNNQTREIEAHEAENKRLNEKIISMNDTITELSHDIDNYKSWNADLHRDIKSEINGKNDLVDAYEKKYDEFEKKIAELERQNKYLTKELNQTCTCKELDLKGHQSRETALVNTLADKNDEIKELKEEIEELKKKNFDDFKRRDNDIVNQAKRISELKDDIKELKEERDKLNRFLKMQEDLTREWKNKYVEAQKEIDEWESDTSEYETITQYKELIDGLNKDLNYWKDQERIRTDQLRATERKVDELWGLVNELKKEKKEVDEYVKSGFKLYVKNTLTEAEGNKNEANEIITEAVRSAYAEWGKRQAVRSAYTKRDKTQKENEKTIKKVIKSEVDKKRIVDIGEGAEIILGVSRELFDDAVKALVDDGYQEIIGRIPQATNSYAYMDMHVLATPDVETKETANPENIKSLDSGIPCGSDAIE